MTAFNKSCFTVLTTARAVESAAFLPAGVCVPRSSSVTGNILTFVFLAKNLELTKKKKKNPGEK